MTLGHQEALKHLQEVEEKAAEILTDRQEIIAYNKRLNDDRVGMRALQKADCRKAWVTVGPLLLKMPSETAQGLLMRDQTDCDYEINKLRSGLRDKVNELRHLELKPSVPGLMLQPLTHQQLLAVSQAWGGDI